ncbi:RNA-directed DNA polymerase, eukaryota [Tanacetum coccineum]
MENISAMEAKILWGNSSFDHVFSEALGNSGGILCLWDPLMFRKDQHIISDNFVVLYGTWVPNNTKLLIVSVYAPQSATDKRLLWSYITGLLSRWNGEVLVTGDFNEVRFERERLGSVFNVHGANEFNSFISNAGLVEIQLEGYSFTWSHPSAAKISKLDRFLVSEGFLSLFPHISALCLDKNLSDHRPILLREMVTDYGATPFRLYHSWFSFHGFDDMVRTAWNSFVLEDSNGMVRFKKKLQMLKKEIRSWVAVHKRKQSGRLIDIQEKLSGIDHILDQGGVSDEILLSRMELTKQMQDIKSTAIGPNAEAQRRMVDGEWLMSLIVLKKFRLTLLSSKTRRESCRREFRPYSDVQTAFLAQPSDSDGPFIINEITLYGVGIKAGKHVFKVICQSLRLSYGGITWMIPYVRRSARKREECGLKQGDLDSLPVHNLCWNGVHLSVVLELRAGIFQWVLENVILLDCSISPMAFYAGTDAVLYVVREDGEKEKGNASNGSRPGFMVGGNMSKIMLEKIGFGSTPIYPMSLYKVLKTVLHEMESLRRNFFNGVQGVDRKISWVKWTKEISFLMRIHCGFVSFHYPCMVLLSRSSRHPLLSIVPNCCYYSGSFGLKLQGIDFLSLCKRRVGSGMQTSHFGKIFGLGLVRSKVLSNVDDRWAWDLNGDGDFCVKDARDLVDEVLLPKENVATMD